MIDYKNKEVSRVIDIRRLNESVFLQLINTNQNGDLLRKVPHRDFQDLSIIYRWLLDLEGDKITSAIIHNDLFERLDISEDKLFNIAMDNTRNILPPIIMTMEETLSGLFIDDDSLGDISGLINIKKDDENSLFVISNNIGTNGAVSILFEECLQDLASEIDSDLYIMPSSIHEMIAVSTKMGDPNELASMVRQINMESVALKERLSNQVYHYDKDLRKISLATDTLNKRLDEIGNTSRIKELAR